MKTRVPLLAFVLLILVNLATAQASSTITFLPEARMPLSPVYISEVLVDGKPVVTNTPVEVPTDWPNHLAIVITNASPKTVIEGVGKLLLLGDAPPGASPVVGRQIFVGQMPKAALYRRDGTSLPMPEALAANPPIRVAPGKTFTIDFSAVAPEAVLQAKQQTGPVTRVVLGLGTFYFEDETRWSTGKFFKPNSSPGQWDAIDANDFFAESKAAHQ